jgi:ABC-type glycerol-3-phosphate transport system permease component
MGQSPVASLDSSERDNENLTDLDSKNYRRKTSGERVMMAVAVIACIPIVILCMTMLKYFLGGSSMYSAGKE